MEIRIYPTYDDLSAKAAEQLLLLMAGYDKPLLCPASGDTPAGLYKVLSERYQERKENMSAWSFVGLDEWVGLNGSDEGSCRYFIDKTLFRPLQVTSERICFFDGRSANLSKECVDAEQFISERNGIDVAVLGVGMNGHIAMNEPGCSVDGRAQIVTLHPVTKLVGQKYFTQHLELEEGITLGMGTLMESKHIILIVSGKHKSRIVRKMLGEPATNELPASLLLRHPSVTVFLDEDAASGLSNQDLHGDNRN